MNKILNQITMIYSFLRMVLTNIKMKRIKNNNMIFVVDINLYVSLQKVLNLKIFLVNKHMCPK